MGKVLRFIEKPDLSDLEGLSVNGGSFEIGVGFIVKAKIILMEIPNTFRFSTNLEILETYTGDWEIVMTQFLTNGPKIWEVESAFSRIGFRNPEIEEQMRFLCNELIEKGLAKWAD